MHAPSDVVWNRMIDNLPVNLYPDINVRRVLIKTEVHTVVVTLVLHISQDRAIPGTGRVYAICRNGKCYVVDVGTRWEDLVVEILNLGLLDRRNFRNSSSGKAKGQSEGSKRTHDGCRF